MSCNNNNNVSLGESLLYAAMVARRDPFLSNSYYESLPTGVSVRMNSAASILGEPSSQNNSASTFNSMLRRINVIADKLLTSTNINLGSNSSSSAVYWYSLPWATVQEYDGCAYGLLSKTNDNGFPDEIIRSSTLDISCYGVNGVFGQIWRLLRGLSCGIQPVDFRKVFNSVATLYGPVEADGLKIRGNKTLAIYAYKPKAATLSIPKVATLSKLSVRNPSISVVGTHPHYDDKITPDGVTAIPLLGRTSELSFRSDTNVVLKITNFSAATDTALEVNIEGDWFYHYVAADSPTEVSALVENFDPMLLFCWSFC